MKSKELIRIMIKHGWDVVRQKGSHIHFRNINSNNLVTIPHPVLDIPRGTMNSILKKAGLTI